MSRIGKHPVAVPGGVTVSDRGPDGLGQGQARGSSPSTLPPEVAIALEDGEVTVTPRDEEQARRGRCGACPAPWSHNMVKGVSEGYTRKLEISGVGYRAAVEGKVLNLQLGFSHDIKFAMPEDIKIACETPTAITDQRRRQAAGRADRGRDPRFPSARALQGQGREVRGGTHPPQGRQEEVGHGQGS